MVYHATYKKSDFEEVAKYYAIAKHDKRQRRIASLSILAMAIIFALICLASIIINGLFHQSYSSTCTERLDNICKQYAGQTITIQCTAKGADFGLNQQFGTDFNLTTK